MKEIKHRLSIASFLGLLFVVAFGVSCGDKTGSGSGQSFIPQLCFVGREPTEKTLELSGDNKTFAVQLVDGSKPDSAYKGLGFKVRLEKGSSYVCTASKNVNTSSPNLTRDLIILKNEQINLQIQPKNDEEVIYQIFAIKRVPTEKEKNVIEYIDQEIGERLTVHWKK